MLKFEQVAKAMSINSLIYSSYRKIKKEMNKLKFSKEEKISIYTLVIKGYLNEITKLIEDESDRIYIYDYLLSLIEGI